MFAKILAPFAAALLCAAALVLPQAAEKTLLFTGAQSYRFYAHSQSSQAEIVQASPENAFIVKLSLQDLTGESAQYENAEDAFSQAQKYGAEFVFSESAGDVTNYYYYAPRLGGGIRLCGRLVNLHVAVRAGGAAVGSPVIFGGY